VGRVRISGGRRFLGVLVSWVQEGFRLIGVIDQPIAKERWVEESGRKTKFNGKPAQNARRRELKEAMLASFRPALIPRS